MFHGIQDKFLVNFGYAQTPAGAVQALDIFLGSEQLNVAGRRAVDFEPFKDGLSIVQNTIQQWDGRIEVVSEVGRGSTFHILIPVFWTDLEYESQTAEPQPEFWGHGMAGGSYEEVTRQSATGCDCWHVVANQVGGVGHVTAYGHSLIIDPSGDVIADTGAEEGMVVAETGVLVDPAALIGDR